MNEPLKNMRILVLAEVFSPEDFLINDLVSYWADQGYDIEVLSRVPSYPFGKTYQGYKNRLYQTDDFKGLKVHRIAFLKGYRNSVFFKVLNYLLYVLLGTLITLKIGRKFDKFFIYQTGPLTLALPGIIAGVIYRKKSIIWTQDLWPDTVFAYGIKKRAVFVWLLNRLVKFVYKRCDHIFVTCPGFIPRLKRYVPDKELVTAYNWPLTSTSGSVNGDIALRKGFNFTFTGNIGKVQNLENVICAFRVFSRGRNGVYLNIVGDGSHLDRLKQLVHQLGLDNVIFWGKHPVSDMPVFYKESDVLFFSLKDEPIYELTIPLKFQSYLTSGKPIFGIIKGDAKKLIDENRLGFTADPSNLDSISAAFGKFQGLSEEELGQMSRNSVALLEEKFNREKIISLLTERVFT